MSAESVAFVVIAYLLTYALHSTLLLTLAWLATARLPIRSHRVRAGLWKLALLGGVLTAGTQLATGWKPYGGLFSLGVPARTVAAGELAPEGGAEALHWVHAPVDVQATGALAGDKGEVERTGELELVPLRLDRSDRPAGRELHFVARRPARLEASPARLASTRAVEPARDVEPARVALLVATSAREAGAHPERELHSILALHTDEPLWVAEDEPTPAGSLTSAGFLASKRAPAPPPWLAALLLAAWFAGAARGTIRLTASRASLRDRLRGRIDLRSGRLPALLADLRRRAGVRRRVRLTCSPRIATPISLGVLRAEICVPLRAVTDLGPREQESMLAHELAHVVRRDAAWLHLHQLLGRLFFFQPLNRLALRRIQESTECLCDDWAVARTGERLALARCLTQVAGWVVGAPAALPAPCMAQSSAPLTQRVERLLAAERPLHEGRTIGLATCAGALLTAVAAGAPAVSAFDEELAAPAGESGAFVLRVQLHDAAGVLGLPLPLGRSPWVHEPGTRGTARGVATDAQERVDSRAAVGRTGAARERDVLRLFAQLEAEVTSLEQELGDLRTELDELAAPVLLREALAAMESTLDGLRERRNDLRERLAHEGHAELLARPRP